MVSINGVEATAAVSVPVSTVPGPRTFWIAGIFQHDVGAGVEMFATSEDLTLDHDPYVIGSSQFYTVGEVHWNGTKRVKDTDWEFVLPFKHIIRILVNTSGINTPITLIYYQWDIGVRAGFKITSAPVMFAFDRTSIIAERVPPKDSFFTVTYISTFSGRNPTTMFARYPTIVDDILLHHMMYDGDIGFETFRPDGYKVFSIAAKLVFTWNGSAWNDGSALSTNTMFYSKRHRSIYVFDGSEVNLLFKPGDDLGVYPETLSYPAFGEGIGRNFLQDAYAGNSQIGFPSSYQIAQNPGYYDDWLEI